MISFIRHITLAQSNTMEVVTVATHSEGYLEALKSGCDKINLPITFLGWGEKWKGFGWRIKLLREHIEHMKPETIVICIDAFDVVPTALDLNEIMNRYKSFKKPIVFGVDGQSTNWLHQWGHDRIFGVHRGVTLNGGTYIGTVKSLQTLFNIWMSVPIANETDDQKVLNEMFKTHDQWFYDNVAIDKRGLLFYNNLCGVSDKNQIRIDLRHPEHSHTPSFVHGAGNCNMDDMVEILELPPPKKRERFQYLWNALWIYAPMMWMEIGFIVLILLFVMLGFAIRKLI
jgi:hypothetical protein